MDETETETRAKWLTVRLDEEDQALLEKVALLEKLSKSDIVRRAVRKYAKDFGLVNDSAA